MNLPKIESPRDFQDYVRVFHNEYRYGTLSPTHFNFVNGLQDRIVEYANVFTTQIDFFTYDRLQEDLYRWECKAKAYRRAG